MCGDLVLLALSLECLPPFELLQFSTLHLLHALCITGFRFVQIPEMSLLSSHDSQFLLLQHLHTCLLECLATQYCKYRQHILIKAEQFIIFNKRFGIDSSLKRDLVGCLGSLNYEVSLISNLIVRGLVCLLLHELVCLNVDVLAAGNWLRCAHFSLEEFL